MAGGETVVEVTPIFRARVGGVDVERLHRIDRLQDALDLRPAIDPQQDLAPGRTKGSVWKRAPGRPPARCPCAR